MLNRRFLPALTLAFLFHGTSAHSLELTEQVEPSDLEVPAFVSVQNASNAPISITLSNGEAFELPEASGKLLPCTEVSGVMLFVNAQSGVSELSATLSCGHVYTVKDDAQ